MKTEMIKDIITARWKFIASNAESIAKTARAMEEAEMLDGDAISQISWAIQDICKNVKSLGELLTAIDPDKEGIGENQ